MLVLSIVENVIFHVHVFMCGLCCSCLMVMLLYFYSYLTALHIAADKAHYDVMDVLLKHGAKVSHVLTSHHGYRLFW